MGLTAISLGRAVSFPFVTWDDVVHILQNPLTVEPLGQGWQTLLTTPRQGYPMPVVVLSWAFEQALFGFNAVVFHLVNLLLHLTNVVLAYLLFIRLRATVTTAARAAALFALHPLVVEPVCWATGRKDLLAVLLLLSALLVMTRGRGASDDQDAPSTAGWVVGQLLCVLACLAKPSAVVAPLLVGLVCWRRFPAIRLRTLGVTLCPLAAAAALITLVGVRGEHALGVLPQRGTAQALMDVVGAYTVQAQNLIWPRDLVAAYYRSPGDPQLWLMISATVALAALGLLAWRRSPARSLPRWGLAFGLVAYLPAANILGIARWVSDSYMYLPLVGLSLGLVALGERLWPPGVRSRVTGPAWIALGLTLGLLSFIQSDRWSSSAEVWQPVAQRYPQNPLPLARQALGLLHDGDQISAAGLLLEHRQRFPGYDEIICDQAWAAARLGRSQQAAGLLKRGVRQKRDECVQRYVVGLLRSRRPPPQSERELVRLAFQEALPRMKRQIRDGAVFLRAAQLLQELGLDALAARAREQAKTLP